MGKRKSRAKPPPKKRMDRLESVFSCPFGNHGSSVACRVDTKNMIGEASCRICEESFSTTITALSEPIDIYRTANGSISVNELTILMMVMKVNGEWISGSSRSSSSRKAISHLCYVKLVIIS